MASLDQKQKREKVQELLEQMDSPEKAYDLFEQTGYSSNVKDPSYKRDIEEFGLKKKAEDKIQNIYTVLNYQDELPVLIIETESLSKTHTDYVTERLTNKLSDLLLIFTSDFRKYQFIFPEFEKEAPGEYDLKTTRLEVDTENVFYSDADALSKIWLEEERNWPHVWNQWEKAFSIDKVTKQFFEDYQEQFFHIREKVLEQIDDVHQAHEFTLQFMNRMMFVYFVDKKGWLEGEEGESYIQWLWDKYAAQGGLQDESEDEFYDEWITELFHKGFNNKFRGNQELPETVNKSFQRAPYLNGGLFRENSLTELDIELEDDVIEEIVEDFFERYNFTIKEDSPVDKEVAVDPQMIGYVYESLSNVADELEDLDEDSRKEFGIFYTPKEEVYFMVRRSLVEYLENNTDISKSKIYKLVFAETDEEKDEAREEISSGEFNRITRTLRQMNAVDPACGSGAFLVGIIDVIAEIYRIAEGKDEREFDMFENKKKIIQESIYGVDVKDWAINASELRLFLQLLIETDVDKEKIQQDALLPNLRANLRVGDSLVQDIDGMFFDLRKSQLSLDSIQLMDEIQAEKSYFFDSRNKSEYDNVEEIKGAEIKLFLQIIEDKVQELEDKLDEGNEKQQTLEGGTQEPSGNEKRQITRQKKETRKRIENLNELKKEVTTTQDKMPLIWEVAFAQVFNTEERGESGFDLLIGNPPYVRQEDIAPPNMDPDNVSKQDKKDYKNKLIESVQNRMPQVDKISKRSDLYIYFYFHGLSLINDDGTFAFITSNSWLDVGYGKELQQFLCKHVPIKGIYNNKNNRSFEHADVNTVISIFGAPNFQTKSFGDWEVDTQEWPETSHEAQFITFKKPYREAVSADNMIALENETHYDKEIQLDRSQFQLFNTQDLRSVQITQKNLLEDGWDYPENFDGEAFEKGKYKGNKWGGKFLRAPDIFYTILDKAGDKLTPIGDIGDVSFGVKTGCNEFFYLPNKHFEIEPTEDGEFYELIPKEDDYPEDLKVRSEHLKPSAKNTSDLEQVWIENDVEKYLFWPDSPDRDKLQESESYIEWGEKQEDHNGKWSERSTVQSRKSWWWLGDREISELNVNYMINQHMRFYYKEGGLAVSNNFHEIHAEPGLSKELATVTNSTFQALLLNILGRSNFGGGLLKLETYEAAELYTVDPRDVSDLEVPKKSLKNVAQKSLFEEIGLERNRPIREQEPDPLPDRKELDDIVFDALGLSEGERKEVYWSVAELVKARLDKAESV